MLNLTRQEKQVILFLLFVAITGLGIKACLKNNISLKKAIAVDTDIFKLDLNRVSLENLLEARCVSRKLAKSIIEFRNANGPFTSIEQLKEVKGIGDYRYEKLKKLFLVK